MGEPLLSIIIPVFNTERYLRACFESILSQSFTCFELIVVDDGSSDGSGEICDEYAEQDNRLRVFHKENGGVSSARNIGLDNARGEWLFFVDSDDELMPDGLQTLVDRISEGVDIVLGGLIEVDENGYSFSVDEEAEITLSKKQSIISLFMGYGFYYPYCGYMCMRLLRRKIIQDNNLCFDTSIAIKEDTLFLTQYICRSNGITRQTTIPVYKYHKRVDSAMGVAMNGFNPKYVDSFYALVKMKHEIEAHFPSFSTPVYVSKQGIYGRYDKIVEMMETHQAQDETLKDELRRVMIREVGSLFLFKVRRKIRKIIKGPLQLPNNHVQ